MCEAYHTNTKRRSYTLWYAYRRNDRVAGREFDISLERFRELVSQPCHYSGAAPVTIHGLDRIDNKIGHVEGNVVPCCSTHNWKRGVKSYEVYVREQAEAGNPVCQARLNELLNQEATHATEGRHGG